MSTPAKYDLPIYQGEQYNLSLTAVDTSGAPQDYTGYVAKAQVRETFQTQQVALQFSVSSGLGPNGVIALSATTSQTVALNMNRDYVWDLKIERDGDVYPICYGNVTCRPRVTR